MLTTEEIAELIPRLRMGGPNASEVADQAADRIEFLEKELDRAYRALCGYAKSADKGEPLGETTIAYHSPTVAAAKRHTILGETDGAEYFIGKHVSVLHEALAL